MRELKFRVWDDFLNDWHATGATTEFMDKCNKGYNFNIVCFGNPERIHIEQYTGLKDKNGREIYEGDIVRWSFKVDRNSELTYTADAVEWESYAEEEWPYSTISGFTLPESEDGYEVIGNIHENPELLGDTNVTNKEEE